MSPQGGRLQEGGGPAGGEDGGEREQGFVSAVFCRAGVSRRNDRGGAPGGGREGGCGGAGRNGGHCGLRVQRGVGQGRDGRLGRLADAPQPAPRFQVYVGLLPRAVPALPLRRLRFFQHLVTHAPGVQGGGVLPQHLDGGVDLPVQVGLVAQGLVEPVQAGFFGERVVLEELGLPAVEAAAIFST